MSENTRPLPTMLSSMSSWRLSSNIKLLVIGLGIAIIGLAMYASINRVTDLTYFSNNSQASESSHSSRVKRLCEKCNASGGVEICKARFDKFYEEYKANKPDWSEKKLLKKAFSAMDSDDKATSFNENNCGDCDMSPIQGKSDFGDHVVNQDDIIMYNTICVAGSPTPTTAPTAIPTTPVITNNCSACDFDNDSLFGQTDATELSRCIFTNGMSNCVNSDINVDNRIDAGDAAAVSVCANNMSAFANCAQADRNDNNVIDSADAAIIVRCPFVSNINVCFNKDSNRDDRIDAGDTSYCQLNCRPRQKEYSQTINLQPGWQLISLYVEPTSSDAADIFAPALAIPNNEFKVFSYINGTWKFLFNKFPLTFQKMNPLQIHAGDGLFVYTSSAVQITVNGTSPTSTFPPLDPNRYNLVGIMQPSPVYVKDVIDLVKYPNTKILHLTPGNSSSEYSVVYEANVLYVSPPQLKQGEGYWIHLNPNQSQQAPQISTN